MDAIAGLRIAIVTASENPYGGVEQITELLKRTLLASGADVRVIGRESVAKSPWAKLIFRLAGGAHRLVGRYFMRRWAHATDVVICNAEFGYGVRHHRSVVCFHGSYLGYAEALQPVISARSYSGLMRLAEDQKRAASGKLVMTACEYNAKVCERQGIKTDIIITNPVDTDCFVPKSGISPGDRCLYVGSPDHWGKGFDVLEEMAKRGVSIDCVTSCRPRHPLLNWLGSVPNSRLPELYPQYAALLLPSRFEGFGLVVLEAMACGTPVLMSNVGFGPDLSLTFPEFVVKGPHSVMAEEMVRRLRNIKERRLELSLRARRYVVDNHSIKAYGDQWKDLIRGL